MSSDEYLRHGRLSGEVTRLWRSTTDARRDHPEVQADGTAQRPGPMVAAGTVGSIERG
ncbi:MAG: hypothetical protein ABEJ86_08440 [Halococcoides sp.]